MKQMEEWGEECKVTPTSRRQRGARWDWPKWERQCIQIRWRGGRKTVERARDREKLKLVHGTFTYSINKIFLLYIQVHAQHNADKAQLRPVNLFMFHSILVFKSGVWGDFLHWRPRSNAFYANQQWLVCQSWRGEATIATELASWVCQSLWRHKHVNSVCVITHCKRGEKKVLQCRFK